MKKFFWILTVVLTTMMLALSCSKTENKKDDPVDPDDPDDPDEPTEEYADYIFTTDILFYYDLGYAGPTIDLATLKCDGKTLWEVFGYNGMADFIAALGTADVANGGAQTDDATIFFGAFDGSTQYLNETVSTTNGWGHWFNSVGDVCSWGEEAYFFTEGYFVTNANLEVTLGAHPGQVTADLEGQEFCIIESFRNEDDETAAIEFHITVGGASPAPEVDVIGTETVPAEFPYSDAYASIAVPADFAAIASTLGLSDIAEATIYGTNADGTTGTIAGTSFWFDTEGNVSSWGEGCAICLEYGDPDGDGVSTWNVMNYPTAELAGNTYSGALTFVNADLKGYVLTVEATIAGQDSWGAAATLSVGGPEVVVDFDIDAIASYLGYDLAGLVTALQDGTVKMMPTNADGSYYLNEDGTPNYSQANADDAKGVFYNLDGNCCNWSNNAGTADEYYGHFYGTMYYGVYEGESYLEFDITPYAAEEDNLGAYSFYMDLTNGEKTAHIVYNVTLESAVPWADYTVGEDKVSYNIRMTPNNDYKSLGVVLDAATLCSAIGVADEAAIVAGLADNSIQVFGLNADGSEYVGEDGVSPAYTANGYGCWFTADGNVCTWGSEGCAVFAENTGENLVFTVGQFPEYSVAGNAYTIKLKYKSASGEAIETFNVSIVESL